MHRRLVPSAGLGLLLLLALAACQEAPAASPTAAKPAATQQTAPSPTSAPTKPAATAAATASPAATKAAGIPQTPASHQPIAQRQDCLACHKQDGFMPAPANHQGRGNETCAGCHQAAAATTPPVVDLVSAKATTPPTVDGQANDEAWAKAKAATIHVNGGLNASETDVTLKSVYSNDSIYFLVQYKDPTESLKRRPWVKQPDGTWKQLGAGERESTYYEDKFAFIWNVNDSIKDFNTQGCAVTCHATTAGRDRPLKYTNAAGELGDMWHTKFVRTLPVGQTDDQYLDDDQKAAEAGRKSDPKTAGGYENNTKEGVKTPIFGLPGNKPAPPYWILDAEKVPFDDAKYKPGDEIPGIVIAPLQGDRGDIATKGVWQNGTWTLEIVRKLTTAGKTDVQFSDLQKAYYFGIANFDNTQIGHAVQYGVTKLTFER